jgi:tetratricopeptide (TPR) repeat protein
MSWGGRDAVRAAARAVIAAFTLLVSLAAAQEPAQFVYVPPANAEKAQESAREFMARPEAKETVAFFLTGPPLSISSERTYVDWRWGDQRISLIVKRGPAVPQSFDYAAMPPLGVVTDTVLGASFYGVRLSPEWIVWVEPRDSNRGLERAKWLADMFSLRLAVVKGREAFERRFQEALAKYPTADSRPPLPEDARRYKIQAEAAVQQRRMADALAFYGKAVELAPWWAEGFFNVALLYAEQETYDGAIRNMKRFLSLEPAHAKAREARDQIYRWEAELRPAR